MNNNKTTQAPKSRNNGAERIGQVAKKPNRNYRKPNNATKTSENSNKKSNINRNLVNKNQIKKTNDNSRNKTVNNATNSNAKKSKPRISKFRKNQKLKLNFLGGIEEVGKNCLAIEYGQDIIVIDAGIKFPTDDMPGIDVVIPDSTFLVENSNRIRGIFITHGHLDHIGGLPYLLREISAPVYATKLTQMLVKAKLQDEGIKANLKTVKPGAVIKAGCFKIEFIHTNHSILDAIALAITTPEGVIVHTGDFKIDYTPVDGKTLDLTRFAELGKKGVLLLMADSTNVERDGYTMSERVVGEALEKLFEEHSKRRIIVATFASNVHRIQQIVDIAKRHRRKVAFSGRSMLQITDAAIEIGALKVPDGMIVDIDKVRNIHDKNLVIISTGSQGEPLSALTRMAMNRHYQIKIGDNDTVILSATPIPGNEKSVYNVINNLYKLGAEVIYSKLKDIHVSGHACKEELKLIHTLVHPKYFIPVHGEYRHLKKHADLAISLGMNKKNVLIPENGATIEVGKTLRRTGSFKAGAILIDGKGRDQERSVTMRERLLLSEDGVIIVVGVVDERTGMLMGDVEIIPRGISFPEDENKLIEQMGNSVNNFLNQVDLKTYNKRLDAKEKVRSQIRNAMKKNVGQDPMVIPIIMSI